LADLVASPAAYLKFEDAPVSQPPAYNRSFSFSNFQAQNPTAAFPGSAVDDPRRSWEARNLGRHFVAHHSPMAG
jgi:hypothetical protein